MHATVYVKHTHKPDNPKNVLKRFFRVFFFRLLKLSMTVDEESIFPDFPVTGNVSLPSLTTKRSALQATKYTDCKAQMHAHNCQTESQMSAEAEIASPHDTISESYERR